MEFCEEAQTFKSSIKPDLHIKAHSKSRWCLHQQRCGCLRVPHSYFLGRKKRTSCPGFVALTAPEGITGSLWPELGLSGGGGRWKVGRRLAQQMWSPGAVNTDRGAWFRRGVAGRQFTSTAVLKRQKATADAWASPDGTRKQQREPGQRRLLPDGENGPLIKHKTH